MPTTITPWLKPFLSKEINSVIDWKNGVLEADQAEDDTVQRYDDNGSSYLIETDADDVSLHIYPLTQLVKVVSPRKPVTVLLSDGQLTLSAVLSDDAVQVIEDEIRVKIDKTLEKDFLLLDHFTIIATHEGPASDAISLDVDAIQYKGILRTFVGSPVPLEDDSDIKELIQSIKASRSEAATVKTRISQRAVPQGKRKLPVKLEEHDDVSIIATQAYQDVQRQSGNQQQRLVNARKSDVQITSGVNLSQPQQPRHTDNSKSLLTLMKTKPVFGTKHVSNQIGPQSSQRLISPPAEDQPVRVGQTAKVDERIEDGYRGQQSGPSQSLQRRQTSPMDVTAIEGTQHLSELEASVHGDAGTNDHSDAPLMKASHRLFEIAEDQRALLDKSSSWTPAMPGTKPPLWNVPSALLSAWNDEQDASEVRDVDMGAEAPDTDNDADSDADSDSSDSDKVSWDASPPRDRHGTPPDSSAPAQTSREAAVRPTSSASLEEFVPQAYDGNKSGHHAARSAHMKQGQRMKWLRETYSGPNAIPFDLKEARTKYNSKFPHDEVSEEVLKNLYSKLLSSARVDRSAADTTRLSLKPTEQSVTPMKATASVRAEPATAIQSSSNHVPSSNERPTKHKSLTTKAIPQSRASKPSPQASIQIDHVQVRATPGASVTKRSAASQGDGPNSSTSVVEDTSLESLGRPTEQIPLRTSQKHESQQSEDLYSISETGAQHHEAQLAKATATQDVIDLVGDLPSPSNASDPESLPTLTKFELFARHWRDTTAFQQMQNRRLRQMERSGSTEDNRLRVLSWSLPRVP